MSEQTAVYRLFNAADRLIYVGMSKSFGPRWWQHAGVQPWWNEVDHQTIYWYPTREDARLAEKKAIYDEHPLYNVLGKPREPQIKSPHTGFMVTPKATLTPRRPGSRNKTPLIGWHSVDPTLKPWIEAEVQRQGINQREFLDTVLAEYRDKRDPESKENGR